MAPKPINQNDLKALYLKNWMTHDALWVGEVASQFGMTEAGPMNLRVCRKLGRIEFQRLMQLVGISSPKNLAEYRNLFELGKEVFVPDFMKFEITYLEPDQQVFHVLDCFAYKGMTKTGFISEYQCGIFERIEGWLDSMGLSYSIAPSLTRCLKFKGNECRVIFKLDLRKEYPDDFYRQFFGIS
ncbi:MAG: DUF6125 family protein [Pseudomonadota bacterium]